MKKALFLSIAIGFFTSNLLAQTFQLSAELRPRFENKHAYQTLLAAGQNGSSFISQRSRLNVDFTQKNLKLKISFQNVRVWGDVSTLAANDKANSFHEAWAAVKLSDNFTLKLGRQEIVYDDSRIFGNVGWAQQARSHDAAIAKFSFNNKSKLDVGFALNADSDSGVNNLYSNIAGYKNFQYVWYHTQINHFGLSVLALNTGVEFIKNTNQKIDYSQIIGTRLTYKKDRITTDAAGYLQTGSIKDATISANYFGGNINYQLSDKFLSGFGIEYLSGKDTNDSSVKLKSFNPLFGTNHKFNGWMDYFYVGNHINSVGLVDVHATIAYKKNKFSAQVVPHIFSSAASIYNGVAKMNSHLGTEIDLTAGYKIANNITFSAGYSKMFASKSLEFIKGGNRNSDNSWTWLMFTFKPTLFTSK